MLDVSRRSFLSQVLASSVDVRKLGAKADGISDDSAAIQQAIDLTPSGGLLFLPGRHIVAKSLIIIKPITISSTGSGFPVYSHDEDFTIKAGKPDISVFVLRANDQGFPYFPGYHGVFGVAFCDMKIVGAVRLGRSGKAIEVDTTPYEGDNHVRGLTFDNVNIRYFDTAIELIGISYLNNFFCVRLMQCNTGIRAARGRASDSGGQTRLYGCEIIATKVCMDWDYAGGSLSLFGCTLSESEFGLKAHENAPLTITGCEFESLKGDPKSAGIYIHIKNAENPNSDVHRTILGNKFLFSTHDIYIEKSSSAFAGGGVRYPMLVDGNSFGSPIALRSDPDLDQACFVFGGSNAGPGGSVQPSQIVDFAGFNAAAAYEQQHELQKRHRHLQLEGTDSRSQILHWFELKSGQTLHLLSVERYTLNIQTGDALPMTFQIFSLNKLIADLSGVGITSSSITNTSNKTERYKMVGNSRNTNMLYRVILTYRID